MQSPDLGTSFKWCVLGAGAGIDTPSLVLRAVAWKHQTGCSGYVGPWGSYSEAAPHESGPKTQVSKSVIVSSEELMIQARG